MSIVFFWVCTYVGTNQNILKTCLLSGKRSFPFGPLVLIFYPGLRQVMKPVGDSLISYGNTTKHCCNLFQKPNPFIHGVWLVFFSSPEPKAQR